MTQTQKKYVLTGETKSYTGHTLHRIRRISGGQIGGWIESEKNLSHEGTCWVHDDAQVSGDAVATTPVEFLRLTRDAVTVPDKHIAIGCEVHLLTDWLKRGFIQKIGKKHEYSKEDIKIYSSFIKSTALLCGLTSAKETR
jgi:hypothetical protein